MMNANAVCLSGCLYAYVMLTPIKVTGNMPNKHLPSAFYSIKQVTTTKLKFKVNNVDVDQWLINNKDFCE